MADALAIVTLDGDATQYYLNKAPPEESALVQGATNKILQELNLEAIFAGLGKMPEMLAITEKGLAAPKLKELRLKVRQDVAEAEATVFGSIKVLARINQAAPRAVTFWIDAFEMMQMGEFEEAKESFDGLIKLAKVLGEECNEQAEKLMQESDKMWQSQKSALAALSDSDSERQKLEQAQAELKHKAAGNKQKQAALEQKMRESKQKMAEAQQKYVDSANDFGNMLKGCASTLTGGLIKDGSAEERQMFKEQIAEERRLEQQHFEMKMQSLDESSNLLSSISGLEVDENYEKLFVGPGLALAASALVETSNCLKGTSRYFTSLATHCEKELTDEACKTAAQKLGDKNEQQRLKLMGTNKYKTMFLKNLVDWKALEVAVSKGVEALKGTSQQILENLQDVDADWTESVKKARGMAQKLQVKVQEEKKSIESKKTELEEQQG